MESAVWGLGQFKGSLFVLVFGFVFIALFWQLRSVEKTIQKRKERQAEDGGGPTD